MKKSQPEQHAGNYFGCGLPEEAPSAVPGHKPEKKKPRPPRVGTSWGHYFGCGEPTLKGPEDAGDHSA